MGQDTVWRRERHIDNVQTGIERMSVWLLATSLANGGGGGLIHIVEYFCVEKSNIDRRTIRWIQRHAKSAWDAAPFRRSTMRSSYHVRTG